MHRYEFIEILVYLANFKYKLIGVTETIAEALEKLLLEDIFPNNTPVEGMDWRVQNLYNIGVEEILAKNDPVLRKLYNAYITKEKPLMTIQDCEKLL